MMDIDEFSLLSFDGAIQSLRKWKIIPYKAFHVVSPETHKKSYTYKYVTRLIKAGIVRKLKLPRTNACVLLPSKKIMDDFNISLTKEQFTHDTIVSYVASAFVGLEQFKNCDLFFEHESIKFNPGSVIPDIELRGIDNISGDRFKIAIEVELSRKAFSKIDDKLNKYVSDEDYDHVVYVFTNLELFELFKNRISTDIETKTKKAIQDKFSLVLIRDYLLLEYSILDSRCFSGGKEGVVRDFF